MNFKLFYFNFCALLLVLATIKVVEPLAIKVQHKWNNAQFQDDKIQSSTPIAKIEEVIPDSQSKPSSTVPTDGIEKSRIQGQADISGLQTSTDQYSNNQRKIRKASRYKRLAQPVPQIQFNDGKSAYQEGRQDGIQDKKRFEQGRREGIREEVEYEERRDYGELCNHNHRYKRSTGSGSQITFKDGGIGAGGGVDRKRSWYYEDGRLVGTRDQRFFEEAHRLGFEEGFRYGKRRESQCDCSGFYMNGGSAYEKGRHDGIREEERSEERRVNATDNIRTQRRQRRSLYIEVEPLILSGSYGTDDPYYGNRGGGYYGTGGGYYGTGGGYYGSGGGIYRLV